MSKSNSKTAGTEEGSLTAWDRSAKGQMCHAYARHMGVTTEQAAASFSAWLQVQTDAGFYLYWQAPVCTNCTEAVETMAWESAGRRDTIHTKSAATMLAETQAAASEFQAELGERGISIKI